MAKAAAGPGAPATEKGRGRGKGRSSAAEHFHDPNVRPAKATSAASSGPSAEVQTATWWSPSAITQWPAAAWGIEPERDLVLR
jgi:hypothetical protein